MKKLRFFLMCSLFVCLLCACDQEKSEVLEPVNFYYCNEQITYNSPSGVICPEIREAADHHGDLRSLLDAYLTGPLSAELVSPFPAGTKLTGFELIENEAYLTFSQELSSLSGVRLSTACSCIAMTVSELVPVTEVHFRVENGQLDNKDELVVSAADIVLVDDMNQKG